MPTGVWCCIVLWENVLSPPSWSKNNWRKQQSQQGIHFACCLFASLLSFLLTLKMDSTLIREMSASYCQTTWCHTLGNSALQELLSLHFSRSVEEWRKWTEDSDHHWHFPPDSCCNTQVHRCIVSISSADRKEPTGGGKFAIPGATDEVSFALPTRDDRPVSTWQ